MCKPTHMRERKSAGTGCPVLFLLWSYQEVYWKQSVIFHIYTVLMLTITHTCMDTEALTKETANGYITFLLGKSTYTVICLLYYMLYKSC